MNRSKKIKKLTEGRDPHLIKWLSLNDWDTLPSEDIMDHINEAWDGYGDDTDGFTRYVRYLLRENTVTAEEIYYDLLRDPDDQYAHIEDLESHDAYAETLVNRYDVYWLVVHEALRMVRAHVRRNR